MELLFIERFREEVRFESVDALIAQIGRDIDRTMEVLRTEGQGSSPSPEKCG